MNVETGFVMQPEVSPDSRRDGSGPATASPAGQFPSALAACLLTSLVALGGAWFGSSYLSQTSGHHWNSRPERRDLPAPLRALTSHNGMWYAAIARDGYSYNPDDRSPVVFFPAYPLAGRAVIRATGLTAEPALLLVSFACLLGSFVLLGQLAAERFPDSATAADWTLLGFGLWPTTAFLRMALSDGLLVLLCLAALWAMQRGWTAWKVALICGLAAATRSVGVALVPVLWLYIYQRAGGDEDEDREPGTVDGPSASRFLKSAARAAVLTPVACWGLLAFMAWQWRALGDPLAFAKGQRHWADVGLKVGFFEQLPHLWTLEPIWSVYVPSSPAHWANFEMVKNPLFSLQFMNPVWFVLTAGLIALGTAKGWLNRRECLLGALLLLIPYVAHSYRTAFTAEGRYAAAAVPVYLVIGRLASAAPPVLAGSLCGVAGLFLGIYAGRFAAWHRVY